MLTSSWIAFALAGRGGCAPLTDAGSVSDVQPDHSGARLKLIGTQFTGPYTGPRFTLAGAGVADSGTASAVAVGAEVPAAELAAATAVIDP